MKDRAANFFLDVKRVNILGVGVSAFNRQEAVDILINAEDQGQRGYVCVTGVHGVIESQRDPELRRIHNRSFLTVPDGKPLAWIGRRKGAPKMGRVYGPDLMLSVCEAGIAHSKTHFLYGATEEILEKLKANLEIKFPGIQIEGTYAPPFRPLNAEEEKELKQQVQKCRPDFLWVGLSTPKQERFMMTHDPRPEASALHPLSCGILFGVGAAFPIHAGLQTDPPEWIKESGMQWFYRLIQDPRRLWRRYFDIVPRFLFLEALQWVGLKKYEIES